MDSPPPGGTEERGKLMDRLAGESSAEGILCLTLDSNKLGGVPVTPQPGDILVLKDWSFEGARMAYEIQARYPWLPVVVQCQVPSEYKALPPGLKIPASVATACGTYDAFDLRAAVRNRPMPHEADICGYIARRCQGVSKALLLKQVSSTTSTRTLRREAARLGTIPHRQWKEIVATILLITQCMKSGRSQSAVVVGAGHHPSYLSEKCRRVFGIRCRDARRLSSWEALSEVAVRYTGMELSAPSDNVP